MSDQRHVNLIEGLNWAALENRLPRTINPVVNAGGTAIGNATEVLLGRTAINAANNAAAVKLPSPAADGPQTGHEVTLLNLSSDSILPVFPNAGAAIAGRSENASVNVAAGALARFCLMAENVWAAEGIEAE
jgi:hypothetical protein